MKIALFFALVPAVLGQTWSMQASASRASLRGVSVVNGRVAWASGTGGTVLRSLDGGTTWLVQTGPGGAALDFRGVRAFSSTSAVLMASGDGDKSGVYATRDGGARWTMLYRNPDAKGFFDAIVFRDPAQGMVLGDPVDGRFTLLRIDVYGGIARRVKLPAALAGEGAFAASNTSLVLHGKHVWFGTGGPSGARVFRSNDGGETWLVTNSLVRGDANGAGIFSLAFADDRHGVAVGGNYEKPHEDVHNVALTSDGGATWTEPSGTRPRGYRSAVAWLPQHKWWIAAGPTGSEISRDGGQNWVPFDDGAFNAIGIGKGDVCFAVGPQGRIARLEWDAVKAP